MLKRLIISILTGAVLGVICILGAQLRYSGTLSSIYLLGFYFNRLLMGLVIGLSPQILSLKKLILRGIILGLVVSFAFYSATEFLDLTGFLVGAVYGIIIEIVSFKLIKKES